MANTIRSTSLLLIAVICLSLTSCDIVSSEEDLPDWVGDWQASNEAIHWIADADEITKVYTGGATECSRAEFSVTTSDEEENFVAAVNEAGEEVEYLLERSEATLTVTVLDSFNEEEIGDQFTFLAAESQPFDLEQCERIERVPSPLNLPITLQPKTQSFTFPEFNAEDVENGAVELVSSREDLEDNLRDDGFGVEEVVTTGIVDANLQKLEGSEATLSLGETELFLQSVGDPEEVRFSELQGVELEDSVQLNLADQAATSLVRSGQMESRLETEIEEIDDGRYTLAVEIVFLVEVEGI